LCPQGETATAAGSAAAHIVTQPPFRRPAVDELETYARAAARLSRLEIEDAWWPAVRRHLGVLMDRAALVAAVDLAPPPPPPAADAGGQS
jgi:hypothetical protein